MKRHKKPSVEREERVVPFQSWTTRMYSAKFKFPEEWTDMHQDLTAKRFKNVLDEVVKNMSRALVVTSLVLDQYARLCHEHARPMEFKRAIRQAMVVCKQGASYPKIELLARAFEQLAPDLESVFGVPRKADKDVVHALWIPNGIIAYANNAMWDTTLWLYSTEAIWRHVDACLRAKFPDLKTEDRDRVLERLQGEREDCDPDAWEWLGDLVRRISDLVRLINADHPKDEKNAIRDRIMSQAASIRIEMLKLMESEISTDEEIGMRFRRFAIIPEFSARRHFVRVDKSSIQEILQKILGPVSKKESLKRPRSRRRYPSRQAQERQEYDRPYDGLRVVSRVAFRGVL